MGIMRVERPEKGSFGWYVRVSRNGTLYSKMFSDGQYGGKRAAQRAAREFNDALLAELGPSHVPAARQPGARNTSGEVGVSRTVTRSGKSEVAYWQACWSEKGSRRKSVKFSIAEHGEERARQLAVQARREAIKTGVAH